MPRLPSNVSIDRQDWRLLPSEEVLWYGRPEAVGYDRRWTLVPLFLLGTALIFGAFAGLVWVADLPGAGRVGSFAIFLALFAATVRLAPKFLIDPCEYLVTNKRVFFRRGAYRRSMERHAVNYARIRWHRSAPGVGHLELVRAVPFGPLARQMRIQLLNVQAPDAVYATIRDAEQSEHAGDNQVPLIERLEPGENVVWGAHPEGLHLGWREVAIALLGVAMLVVAGRYLLLAGGELVNLEDLGLATNSWTWAFFFLAVAITWSLLIAVGAGLLWYGVWRARSLGASTEYLLTDRRLLIRRGLTELSVDRKCIVDVAHTRTFRGLHHVFLVLDAPNSRALADSGALNTLLPARDAVGPVLYELRDVDGFRAVLQL
ncbi:MAG: hypothetical protein AAGF12_18505 [Myxococcota bacterium]